MGTRKIIVFSKPSCVQCTATYRALDKHNLQYQIVDISEDEAARAEVTALGYQQAPVVYADGDHWAGFRPDRIKDVAITRAIDDMLDGIDQLVPLKVILHPEPKLEEENVVEQILHDTALQLEGLEDILMEFGFDGGLVYGGYRGLLITQRDRQFIHRGASKPRQFILAGLLSYIGHRHHVGRPLLQHLLPIG